jgi:hypothetical protein
MVYKDYCAFLLRALSNNRYILEKKRRQYCICTGQIISSMVKINQELLQEAKVETLIYG